jgi:DNA polymerase III subunit chi
VTEILFYHLTESTLDQALPPLVARSLERGWRAVIQCGTEERRDALDTQLWTWSDESFLAHGTDREPHAEHQPVLLTLSVENANGAQIRFLVDGAEAPDLAGYARAVFMFDGHDEAQLGGARANWAAMKKAGHEVTYWQQGEDRRWVRKA